MKATDLLVKQHKKVKSLFHKLEKGRGEAAPLVEELASNLAAHMLIEHELFYPAAKDIDHELIDEAFEEHALAELALKRLIATDPEDEAFAARVTACKELIEHHVEEEEEELFPKFEKKVGAERSAALAKAMKARFEEVLPSGFEGLSPKGMSRTAADSGKRKLSQAA